MISKVEKCTMKRFYLLYKLFVHTCIYVDMDINVNIFKCFLNDLILISITQLANKKEIFRNKSFVISYC